MRAGQAVKPAVVVAVPVVVGPIDRVVPPVSPLALDPDVFEARLEFVIAAEKIILITQELNAGLDGLFLGV